MIKVALPPASFYLVFIFLKIFNDIAKSIQIVSGVVIDINSTLFVVADCLNFSAENLLHTRNKKAPRDSARHRE